ncbi:MAG: hypothetical protein SFV20_12270 [Sphingopyxis sp.]|nr:hypothetical protein [Sphingopyxis sp.]
MNLMDLMILAAGIAAIAIWSRPMTWWTKIGLSAFVHIMTVGIVLLLNGPATPYGTSVFYQFFYVLGVGVAVMVGGGFGWLYRWLMHRPG